MKMADAGIHSPSPTPPSFSCRGDPCGRPLYAVRPTPHRGGSETARLPPPPDSPSRCPRACGDPFPFPHPAILPRPLPPVGATLVVARYMLCDQPLVGAVREPPAPDSPSRCPRGCGDPSPFPMPPVPFRAESRNLVAVKRPALPLAPTPLACYLAHRGGGQLGYRRQRFPNPKRQVVNHVVRNLVGHGVLVIGGVVTRTAQEIPGLPPRFYRD